MIDIAISNSHNLHITIIEKLHKRTDPKQELTKLWQLYVVYIVPLLLSTMGGCPNKITRQLDTADSALWSIYSDAAPNTEHVPLS